MVHVYVPNSATVMGLPLIEPPGPLHSTATSGASPDTIVQSSSIESLGVDRHSVSNATLPSVSILPTGVPLCDIVS